MGSLGLNESYAKSQKGLLKIFVIITTCIAFAIVVDMLGGHRSANDRVDFFISIHIAGFVIAIIIFLVYLISLENTLGSARCWLYLNLAASLILGILCIVASGLLCEYANKNTEKLIAAIVFGFLSGVLFLIDALIHFKEVR
ncbi:uncharacterized protein LOC110248790 [Exaiptasia diaphana]|uniref:MARVEL domain-containing protein n=1 Tax=Exaiptasia diaphana TaxID=2652724 RepID=A0A913XWP2_EXADI|nr:uncharacterized protein LOC110248790 [Exaiptasia diaphana]KXJ24227.1 hypothetical protein AC249_AIPGENE4692 [Exaiptasia diaphana]